MTDTEDTKPTEVQPEPEPAAGPAPRRLLRSREDRVIAGVSGGLGRYFDIDPVIVRIAFAVSVLFGGLGIVAYIAAALFVPADDGTGSPAPTSRGQAAARTAGVVLLAIVALCGLGTLVAVGAFLTGLGYGWTIALAIVAAGLLLIALAFRGGAKWLIVPAIALGIGAGTAAAADLDLEGGIGQRDYVPTSASAIPSDGYELGVGQLRVDLRQIDWSPERVLDLEARVGAGEMVIAVPSDVCVVAHGHAGAGDVQIAGQRADGIDVDLETGGVGSATPQLRLDADVDMGAIRVLNDDAVEVLTHDRWEGWDHDDGDPAARAANEEACSG